MVLNKIPVPFRGLWGYETVTTLLSVASNGDIEIKPYSVTLNNPLATAQGILEISRMLYESRIRVQLAGNDKQVKRGRGPAIKVADSLCITTDVNTPNYIKDLGEAIAGIISGEKKCDSIYEMIAPVSILKPEYYDFYRSYTIGSYRSKNLKIPAITQGIGIIGHAYTWFATIRTGNRKQELHLNISNKEFTGVGELYRAVHSVYREYYRGRDPQPSTSILQLLAAGAIASSKQYTPGVVDYGIEIVSIIPPGRRCDITGRNPIPIKSVLDVLEDVDASKFYEYYKGLVFASVGYGGSLAARGIEDVRGELLRVMTVYSEYLVLYSYTLSRDYIYMAMRELYSLAHESKVVEGVRGRIPLICLNPPCGNNGRWLPLYRVLAELYELSSSIVW